MDIIKYQKALNALLDYDFLRFGKLANIWNSERERRTYIVLHLVYCLHSFNKIYKASDLGSATLTRYLKRLTDMGLIEKDIIQPKIKYGNNKLAVGYFLTAKGHTIYMNLCAKRRNCPFNDILNLIESALELNILHI